ncbi:hypothetical protein ACJX0J_027024, partial [Zea mays]
NGASGSAVFDESILILIRINIRIQNYLEIIIQGNKKIGPNVYDQGRTYKRKHNHEEIDVEIGCGDANEKQGKQRTRVGILMMLPVGSLIALLISKKLPASHLFKYFCGLDKLGNFAFSHLFPKLIVYFGLLHISLREEAKCGLAISFSLPEIIHLLSVEASPACLYSSLYLWLYNAYLA